LKFYTLKEASKLLNITYRAVRYYKDIYVNDVKQDGKLIYVSEAFIEKVKKNRVVNENKISEKRTKKELLAEIEDLKEQLSQYDINDNERIEVFTLEDYEVFKERLTEWRLQRQELELKDKHFAETIKSKDELTEHYKNQYYYQRQLATNQLKQIEKLIETVGHTLKNQSERARIEAVEKKVIPGHE